MSGQSTSVVAQIEGLRVRNYRALKNVEFKGLSKFSVLLGANGSGKSTVFDVFAFLADCFGEGLRRAWDKRGRFKELRSRHAEGNIEFEIRYREQGFPLVVYHLSIGEEGNQPYVAEEWLRWKRGSWGQPFRFLDFANGSGRVISGDLPEADDERIAQTLDSSDLLAVNTLGQFAQHPRVSALRRFISGWYLSYLTAEHARGVPEAGPQERMSRTGDNLPNVIQYLKEQHPDRLRGILEELARRVPRLESVDAELMADGRLLLQIKDAPFVRPILAKWTSDGTLKMLAYLLVLRDPHPPPFVGIEEPENHLYPSLLPELAEECRGATEGSQLMVSTHSREFVNAVTPDETWVLARDADGYTRVSRASEIPGISEFVQEGAGVGDLWLEGHLNSRVRSGAG